MSMGRKNQDNIVSAIQRMVGFTIGNVKAEWCSYVSPGRLPREWVDDLTRVTKAARKANVNVYVVFSYQTPMAWYYAPEGWTFPDVKYSPTTTQHQHYIRNGITTVWMPEIRTTPALDGTALPYQAVWA